MIGMLFDYYLFIECSPILIPFECLPEVSKFFLEKDPYFWISFMVVSIIVLSRLNKEMKEDFHFLVSPESSSTKISLFLLLFFCVINWINLSLGLGLQPNPSIAYCEGGNAFTPPPSPVQLPEEPVTTPPEEPPVESSSSSESLATFRNVISADFEADIYARIRNLEMVSFTTYLHKPSLANMSPLFEITFIKRSMLHT